ncbi:condensation domain-containing protein [Pseudoalteromonas luteoviolacea]|uniref:non-ribosomal peptide synthetase n=1 Tax=Pseudoalteromonas luteoviolacea TaxID=43657 RepID=UPI001F1904EB|nr:condensation domain-containing protein [Pseudoalteromonas luteoviolacea]MCF6437891.1 condensation domain-containing protein [Pseudoalteromonas luteoviolacea]
MKLSSLLEACHQAGIRLSAGQGKLRVNGADRERHADLLLQLKNNKAALIEILQASNVVELVPQNVKSNVPLSFNQQRIYLSSTIEAKSAIYHMPIAMKLTGDLNLSALEYSFNQVIQRHEILRTRYSCKDDQFFQTVAEPSPLAIEYITYEDIESDVASQIDRTLAEHAERVFDLEEAEPIRLLVIKCSGQEHIMSLVIHHIAFDGWSQSLLVDEIVKFYSDYVMERDFNLAPLPIQYTDFAIWQRKMFDSKASQRELDYWLQQLKDLPTLHSIPTDLRRQSLRETRYEVCDTTLSKDTSKVLADFAQAQQVSLFMLLYAAFNCLVAKWSNNEDVVVGTPVAGRNSAELEKLLGFFINTVVLRNQVSDKDTFLDVLGSSKRVVSEAFEHQSCPFELLVEKLNPKRNNDHTPLFQIWFVMQNNEQREVCFPELETNIISQPNPVKYEISVYITQTNDGLNIQWCYASNLFEAQTIDYVAGQFNQFLEQLVENKGNQISKLPLFLSESLPLEGQLDGILQSATRAMSNKASVYERFTQIALNQPSKSAVVTTSESWSYAGLLNYAEQLALLLSSQKAKCVGLMLGHNPDMVAMILAALKLGITYVPISASYPNSRINFLLQDAEIDVLLTNDESMSGLTMDDLTVPVIVLDHKREVELNDTSNQLPTPTIDENELAYILYTSGSTGQPKGVMQSRKGLAYYADMYIDKSHLNIGDKVVQLSSFTFDSAVMDMFGALLSGAQLQLVDVEKETALAKTLDHLQTTVLHCTPTVFRLLCSQYPTRFEQIRLVVLGGEPVDTNDIALFKASFIAQCEFVVGYGLTESTMALQWRPDAHALDERTLPCLGREIESDAVSLSNAQGAPCSIFEPGEIVLWLDAIARGYKNQTCLTNETFFEKGGRRGLRTGDYGIRMPDGNIRFLGRRDGQIKFNGIRIEVAEIEGEVRSLPDVKDAAVVVVEQGNIRQICVAAEYSGMIPEEQKTLSSLKRVLPDYMVPAQIRFVERLPRTHSDKIDRAQLKTLDWTFKGREEKPTSQTEYALLTIWQEIFGRKNIGISDGFFELGGHSLLLIKMLGRIRDTYGIELQYQDLVGAETIRTLGELIDNLLLMKQLKKSPAKKKSMTI